MGKFITNTFVKIAMHKRECKKRQNVGVKAREKSLAKIRYNKNKKDILNKNKTWRNSSDGIKHKMISTSKHRAKINNLEHSITVNNITIPDKCPVFNIEFVPGTKEDGFRLTPSLDRIDSSKGCVKDNIQVISWLANTMKNDTTKEELLLFSNWILSKYNDDIVQSAHIK